MDITNISILELKNENQEFSLVIDTSEEQGQITMLKANMSEKYGQLLNLDTLYSHCKVFGVYENIEELAQDLQDTSNHSPEKITFNIEGDALIISMVILFNEREKILQFRLEKEEMTLEDSNKFLLQSNLFLRE